VANIFIHFEPIGHSLRHNIKTESGGDVDKKYRDALQRGSGGHESDLPSYIVAGTPEEDHWRLAHPQGVVSRTLLLFSFWLFQFLTLMLIHLFEFSEICTEVICHWFHGGSFSCTGR
jgi:hypothetical protein